CTTDDPTDSLEYHKTVRDDDSFNIQMLPTWRPDKAMAVENPAVFGQWVMCLGKVTNLDIHSWDSLIEALRKRHDYFHNAGCRLSDHGVTTVYADEYKCNEIEHIFEKAALLNIVPTIREIRQFKSAMMYEFGVMDAEKGWTQQIHYGALRNNNTHMYKKLGPDTGFDSIGDWPIAQGLSRLLDRLNSADRLPRTIIYSLNPRDNEVLASMLGNFQDGSVPGKIQLGSGWWFNDQIDGMKRQIEALSQMGLLSRFVGMLTDSRSFLSYTRHEYFRRLLCNILGNDMKKGLIPQDIELVGRMAKDICYNNAVRYFGFDLEEV
ncbi:glucuronate isomerase, partial [PVC group bacterium]|nr:glucuronate isomerase [PVC group bacterium]